MQHHKLGPFVQTAYQKLKGLAGEFRRQGNDETSALLAALQAPELPEAVVNMPVDYAQEPGVTEAFSPAVTEATKLEHAADILADAGHYDLSEKLARDATAVKEATAE